MLVLVDGPRGAGKSTVSQALVAKLQEEGHQATYFKKVIRKPEDEFGNMMEHIDTWQAIGGIVVVDRYALSEWTMSIVHNRRGDYQQLTNECSIALLNATAHGFAVILTASAEVLNDRINHRNEHRGWDMPIDTVGPIWRAAAGTFDVQLFDTSDTPVELVVNMLRLTVLALLSKKTTQEMLVVQP